MIKSKDYLQLISISSKILSKLNPDEKLFASLDEVRKLHDTLQSELEYYLVYPHHDLKMARDILVSIKKLCNEFNIEVTFSIKDSDNFKNKNFADYYYMKYQITDLIVFRKKDKQKIEAIDYSLLSLDEEVDESWSDSLNQTEL